MTRARALELTSQVLRRVPHGPWVTYVPTRAAYEDHVEFAVRLFGRGLLERTTTHGPARARRDTWASMSGLIEHHRAHGHDDLVRVLSACAEALGVRQGDN
jgi:hypothetical protein